MDEYNDNRPHEEEAPPVPDETVTDSPCDTPVSGESHPREEAAPASDETVTDSPVSGEYRYRRGEAPFSDADYIRADDVPKTPRSYSYTQPEMKENLERWERSEREKESNAQKEMEKRKRGMSTGAIVALCLVCVLLGTLMGGLLLGGLGRSSAASIGTQKESPAPQTEETELPPMEAIAPAPADKGEENSRLFSDRDKEEELAATEIYDLACQQVVGISTSVSYNTYYGVQSGTVTGTGFIVSSDGYILTNYHVVEYAVDGTYPLTVMLYNGESYPATVVGYEGDDSDIAVLKIDAAGLSAATLGDSSDIRVGETVFAVGNPLGELDYTMTKGMISAMDREIDTGVADGAINMFQIDAAVNSGNSGGPVYDTEGKIIGVVTAKYSDTYEEMGIEGLGFAIPINDAIAIANDLITNGYVRGKAYMGVSTKSVSAAAAQYYNMVEGAYVYAVVSGSCAEKAGLQMGDIITAVDSYEVKSVSDLQSVLKNYKAGQDAVITLFRNGNTMTVTITFDEKQPSTADPTAEQTPQQQQNPYGGYVFGGGSWW